MRAPHSAPGGAGSDGRKASSLSAATLPGRARAEPRPVDAAAYRRRLAARIAICLALGLLFPGRAPPAALAAGARAAGPLRLRGTPVERRAAPEGEPESEEARLRARVAALEEKLGERAAEEIQQVAAPAAGAVEVNPVVAEAWQAVLEELPELQVVDDARLGMMPDKQYVFSAGDASKGNPIYKRKYEVLGMTLKQQEGYMKVFRKAVKKAKDLESVKAVTELMKSGGGGLDKDSVKVEVEKLKKSSRLASLFFRDLLPEVLDNPVANSIAGILASLGLVAVTVLICLCFFPPIPPDIE